jgi:hypothetical protein
LRGTTPDSDSTYSTSTIADIRLEYVYDNDNTEWQFPGIQLTLTNHSNKTLYCNVLLLSENYKVDLPFFEAQSSVRIPPNEQIVSKQIGLFIPPDYLEEGITEYKDILKLIVNTTDFDASLLEQEGLDPATRTRSTIIPKGLLNRLMDRIYTRDGIPFSNESNDHWTTQAIAITILRPQDAKLIQSNQDVVLQE